MRASLVWLHRWSGLALALYVVLISLSGGLLVFHDEIAAAVRVPRVDSSTQPLLSADDIVHRLTAAFPGWHLQTLWWPETPHSPWLAEVRQGSVGSIGETALAVYLHPGTGAILKRHDYGHSTWRWLQLLHFNLLSGRDGRSVNGVLSLVTLFVVLSGILLWWPRDRKTSPLWWMRAPRVNKRFAWEFHQVSSLYLAPFFLVACLTGAYFAWRTPVHRAINTVFPMHFMNTPVATIEPFSSPPKPLASFLPAIAARVPAYPVTRVIFPEQPNQPIRFVVYEGSRRQFFRASNLFFHPGSGELLRADRIRSDGRATACTGSARCTTARSRRGPARSSGCLAAPESRSRR